MPILRKTEKTMCGVKVIEKRSGPDLMTSLSLENTLDILARAGIV